MGNENRQDRGKTGNAAVQERGNTGNATVQERKNTGNTGMQERENIRNAAVQDRGNTGNAAVQERKRERDRSAAGRQRDGAERLRLSPERTYAKERHFKEKERSAGLDIVRCVAVFFVVSVHYFYNNGYYGQELEGWNMFFMTAMRWLFYSCVPLFLILSGFLLNRKKPEKSYYIKIFRILGEYLLACILCNLFKTIYMGKELGAADWIYSILDFSAAPYSWYVTMYTGLFLLIPFLNLAYGRDTAPKKQKQILLASMLFITAMPGIINYEQAILPAWWPRIYPITYYFIGCYLAEYKPKTPKWICALGAVLLALGQAAISFAVADEGKFNWSFPNGYGALPTVGIAVLIFLLFYRIDVRIKWLRKLFFAVSACSLSLYLLSWIADQIVYKEFNRAVTYIPDKLGWYFVIVPTVVGLTVIPAWLCHKLVELPGYIKKRLE